MEASTVSQAGIHQKNAAPKEQVSKGTLRTASTEHKVEDLSHTECSICLDSLGMDHLKTVCNHIFHRECIERWDEASPKNGCPLCRQPNPLGKPVKVPLHEVFAPLILFPIAALVTGRIGLYIISCAL